MAFDQSTIFKAYDVRGTVPDQLDADLAYKVGRALVLFLKPEHVAVGHDMRLSGASLAAAMIDGIRDQGADVIDLGLVSSDALYFAVGNYGYDAGVMITASHNPAEYNGIKMCRKDARPISLDDGLAEIRDIALGGNFPDPADGKRGDVIQKEVLPAYVEYALRFVDTSRIEPFKIAVDAGNGMAGRTIPLLFQHLPCQLVPLYFELDGAFPNHPANPIDPAAMVDLQKTVVDQQCDLGVAFDGDADRMFLVDEKGQLISGGTTTAMVAIALLEKAPGSTICYNLICSHSVPEAILAHGGRPYRTPVGHSLIKKIMRTEDAIFGGEHSGHYYFRDNWYAESGLIAMLAVLSLMSKENKPLSELVAPFENRVQSGEINLTVADKPATIARVEDYFVEKGATPDELDGLTIEYPDRWFNIRASNTEPLLRVNVEGDTQEAMEQLRDEVLKVIGA